MSYFDGNDEDEQFDPLPVAKSVYCPRCLAGFDLSHVGKVDIVRRDFMEVFLVYCHACEVEGFVTVPNWRSAPDAHEYLPKGAML